MNTLNKFAHLVVCPEFSDFIIYHKCNSCYEIYKLKSSML